MDVSRARTKDPDDWLESAPAFSRPLTAQVREWVQRWEPDLVERIKWNCLCYSGRRLVFGLSACKKHLGLVFFRGKELLDPSGLLVGRGGEANTKTLTLRITTLEGLNVNALRSLLRAAVELDASGEPSPPPIKREPWPMPDFFAQALKRDRAAAAFYESLAPTYQREYLVWLSTAKREETREARLRQTLRALRGGYKWIDRKRAPVK